jgi:hypothetical protein
MACGSAPILKQRSQRLKGLGGDVRCCINKNALASIEANAIVDASGASQSYRVDEPALRYAEHLYVPGIV